MSSAPRPHIYPSITSPPNGSCCQSSLAVVTTSICPCISSGGASGLSTGIRFLERQPTAQAEIWARDLPPNTTSNIAAAVWLPYKALPFDRVLAWGKRTLDVFYELAEPTINVGYDNTGFEWED